MGAPRAGIDHQVQEVVHLMAGDMGGLQPLRPDGSKEMQCASHEDVAALIRVRPELLENFCTTKKGTWFSSSSRSQVTNPHTQHLPNN